MQYAAPEVMDVRLSARRDEKSGSFGSHRPVEVPMNPRGSSRPWMRRLLWLAMTLTLCFTVGIGTLHAQQECVLADVNGDGVVDDADLLQVLFCFGTSVSHNPSSLAEAVESALRQLQLPPRWSWAVKDAAVITPRLSGSTLIGVSVYIPPDPRSLLEGERIYLGVLGQSGPEDWQFRPRALFIIRDEADSVAASGGGPVAVYAEYDDGETWQTDYIGWVDIDSVCEPPRCPEVIIDAGTILFSSGGELGIEPTCHRQAPQCVCVKTQQYAICL